MLQVRALASVFRLLLDGFHDILWPDGLFILHGEEVARAGNHPIEICQRSTGDTMGRTAGSCPATRSMATESGWEPSDRAKSAYIPGHRNTNYALHARHSLSIRRSVSTLSFSLGKGLAVAALISCFCSPAGWFTIPVSLSHGRTADR